MGKFPATEKLYEEYKQKITSLVNELDDRNLLKLENHEISDLYLDKVLERITLSGIVLDKWQDIITEGRFQEFLDITKQFKLINQDITHTYGSMLIQHILDITETVRNILLVLIDIEKLNPKIKKTDALGTLLNRLDENSLFQLKDIFNEELRIALAHAKWYFQNNVFYFKADKPKEEIKSYSIAEMMKAHHNIALFLRCLNDVGLVSAIKIRDKKRSVKS